MVEFEQAVELLRVALLALQFVEQLELPLDQHLAAPGQVDEHRVDGAPHGGLLDADRDGAVVHSDERLGHLADLVDRPDRRGPHVDPRHRRTHRPQPFQRVGELHLGDLEGVASAAVRSERAIDRPTTIDVSTAITRTSRMPPATSRLSRSWLLLRSRAAGRRRRDPLLHLAQLLGPVLAGRPPCLGAEHLRCPGGAEGLLLEPGGLDERWQGRGVVVERTCRVWQRAGSRRAQRAAGCAGRRGSPRLGAVAAGDRGGEIRARTLEPSSLTRASCTERSTAWESSGWSAPGDGSASNASNASTSRV